MQVELWYVDDNHVGFIHRANDDEVRYRMVHSLDWPVEADDEEALEALFAAFNRGSGVESPTLDAKELRSMSVGDVVTLRDPGRVRMYRCGSFGWHLIESFTREGA